MEKKRNYDNDRLNPSEEYLRKKKKVMMIIPGGFYNLIGNVWEWCSDWFSPSWHCTEDQVTRINPSGPQSGENKVIKGGSFLCHDSYCNRYRLGARTANAPDSATTNLGFRCARDA